MVMADTQSPAPESAAPVAADSQPAIVGLPGPGSAQALPAAYGGSTSDAPSVPNESDAEPAAPAVPEAVLDSEPEGDEDPEAVAETPGEPKLSRAQREAARRQAEVDQAVQAALTAREQAAQAQAELAAKNEADQQVMQRAAELMGTAAEEDRLVREVAKGNFEAADELLKLRELRERDTVIVQAAERMAWAKVFDQIQAARKIDGVDGSFMDRVGSLPEIFTHVADVTAKRVAADYEGRLERQKADYESRLGRAASQLPTTETGGRAVGAPVRTFTRDEIARMDTATYKRNKAAIYEQERLGQIA